MRGAIAMSGEVVVPIRGERIHLLAERAAWWPRRSTLLVADLHLGKEEALLDRGMPMPDGVLEETLARLEAILRSTGAARLVVLGDLVHAPRGLSDAVVDAVARWRGRFDGALELVPGNHDELVARLPSSWRVARLADAVLDEPFVHLHESRPHPAGYALGGHLHPMVRLAGRVDRVELPCFVIGRRRAVLPAFTRFSRGVRVVPEDGDRLYAVADGMVVDCASAAGG